METTYIHKRGEWYHYRRKVPGAIAHLEKKTEVTVSLKTKDVKQALIKADIYNVHFENYWRSLKETDTAKNKEQKYQAAISLAKAHGFSYMTQEQIVASSFYEILKRINVDFKSKLETDAVLGNLSEPTLLISECWEPFTHISVDRHTDKSEKQIRRWNNPRRLVLSEFKDVIGDKDLFKLERQDALDFREWLLEQIKDEKISGETANKKLSHLKDVLKTVTVQKNIDVDLDAIFASLRFAYEENSRPPFEAEYVQNILLPSFSNLTNKAYQMVCYAIADTGARESEIFGLLPDEIHPFEDIPYIEIKPRKGYKLKTKTSARKIPLVGSALFAFRKYPSGFNKSGDPDSFSSAVNKYLRENNLKPTPEHSLYSLRHTFKDRLRDQEKPRVAEEIIDSLMGHKNNGPDYGRGYLLKTKHEILQKQAFKVNV